MLWSIKILRNIEKVLSRIKQERFVLCFKQAAAKSPANEQSTSTINDYFRTGSIPGTLLCGPNKVGAKEFAPFSHKSRQIYYKSRQKTVRTSSGAPC